MSLPAAGGARPGSLRTPDSLRCLFITALCFRSWESCVLQRPVRSGRTGQLRRGCRNGSPLQQLCRGRPGAERGAGEALRGRCPSAHGGSLGAVPSRGTARKGLGRCRRSGNYRAAAFGIGGVLKPGAPVCPPAAF